jgi:YegS/Rv2252/BmrU family lipid kinase
MKKYVVIYNKQAGKTDNEAIANHFKTAAKAQEHEVTLKATPSREAAIDYLVDHLDDFDTVVTIGGDGSINTAFSAFLKAEKALEVGVIPGGTVNNFAKALQIPEAESAAIDTILNGTPMGVDLAHTADRAIISSLTLGTLADMARNVKQKEKKLWGPLIYLSKGIKELIAEKSYRIKLTTADGTSQVYKTRFLLATMTNSIGGFTHFDADASADDGKLHIVILKHFSLGRLFGYLGYFLTGEFRHATDVDQLVTDQVEISAVDSAVQVETRIDGDPSDALPIQLKVEKQFVNVLVPKK